jgi:hypothetical protein
MADNGFFFSPDSGQRFYTVRDTLGSNIKSIALSSGRPPVLYATGSSGHDWFANQVYVSLDRGTTWNRSSMRGLPDMSEYRCNSIVVDRFNSDAVYLGVSGKVAPGGGGIYISTDRAKTWKWRGEGLPEGEEFFSRSIWHIGREIAIDRSGNIVCFSQTHKSVYYFDSVSSHWRVSRRFSEKPNEIAAGSGIESVFYLACHEEGLFRSVDSGKTWKRIRECNCAHVAADIFETARVAAGTEDGIILSRDHGERWESVDRCLPHRINNTVCFGRTRLIAGSNGNGAFWMPLD